MRNTKKRSFGKKRVTTQFSDQSFVSKSALNELVNSLSVGQKETLNLYRLNLCTSRGVDSPNYDSKVAKLVVKYAKNPKKVKSLLKYLENLKDPKGHKFSRNLKIYSEIEDQMRRFSQSDYTSFRWNEHYQKSLEEMKQEFSKLHFNPLLYFSDEDIKEFLPKLDTHSGYNWILKGDDYKYKGDNMEGVYLAYINEEDKAISTGSFDKPILIGFRTQGSNEFDDYGNLTHTCKHKLRVVSMIDLYQIIGELRFSKPIQDYLASKSYYAGGKDLDEVGRIISGYRADNRYFVTLDYSAFDQTISSWLIEDAFQILKCAFHDLSDRENSLFEVLVHDFINKQFIVSEGIVKSKKGVPSGSMFTQIIDTIVNRLAVKTYFNSINKEVEMIIMGDDNTLFTNEFVNLELISTYLSKNFGLIANADKSRCGLSMKDDVEFLSCIWRDDGRWRSPEVILSKLIYSERYRDYRERIDYMIDDDGNEVKVHVQPKPEHVIWAAYLTYKLGTMQLIDMPRFAVDYSLNNTQWMDLVGESYIPGAMAYIRNYTMTRRKYKNEYRHVSSEIIKFTDKKVIHKKTVYRKGNASIGSQLKKVA